MNASTGRTVSWELARGEGQIGTGNWEAFPADRLSEVYAAAEHWKQELSGIERPWLCWCVDDDWCILQQRLVSAVGWTPIVGTDGQVQAPTIVAGSKFIDFNSSLRLPLMWMHFPLEFAFLFSSRLAFWHSDVLPPVPVMRRIASEFETLRNGELLGVRIGSVGLLWQLRRLAQRKPPRYRRWYEVLGCITAEASASQFQHGCGWWRHPECHPNASPAVRRKVPHWEHGVGIAIWEERFGGKARRLHIDINPYHYTATSSSTRSNMAGVASKQAELRRRLDPQLIAPTLGLGGPNTSTPTTP